MNKLAKWVRRTEEAEQGFTLIELMVVVLIIGILVAIAIPTFLGARDSAENRAAESSLRNAFTSAKVFFTDNNTYSGITTGVLASSEPSLSFVGTLPAAINPNTIEVTTANSTSNYAVCLTAQSKTGNYYSIMDSNAGGTFYASSSGSGATDPCAGTLDYTTSPSGNWYSNATGPNASGGANW